jgi:hypothetical protein
VVYHLNLWMRILVELYPFVQKGQYIMNTILLVTVTLALGVQDVQTSSEAKTQLYVKTTPSGAEVAVDGKTLGKSDGLFEVSPGTHKLTLRMEDYAPEERSFDARQGEITRVEVEMKTQSDGPKAVLGYVGAASKDMQSFGYSGHAVAFQRPAEKKSICGVKLFAARYGSPQPPDEDFHIYLLDENQKVLEQVAVPYSKIERGDLRWYTFEFPAVEVPEKFLVALWFNAEAQKGVHLGVDKTVKETHSYIGLPDKGFQKVDQVYDWMVRAVISSESGAKPTHPKVTTYEGEKAADTETAEALPTRTWNDATGAFSVEAQFAGVEQGKVMLKKPDGKTVGVPLDRLCDEDREFVAKQTGTKRAGKPGAAGVRELSHDNGKAADKSSIAGGGHAVRFKVDDDSMRVTSVSLHGSRYGYPQPPKENFNVWICDAQFKPIATFHFPYGSYAKGDSVWKSFRIRPTPVPREFIVCFGFNPGPTKGVHVSHDDQKGETSLVGIPGEGQPEPFAKGNWLIRCKVEKRVESGTRLN